VSQEPGDGTEIWVLICERNHCCIAAARHHTQTPSGCLSPDREDLTPAHLTEIHEEPLVLYKVVVNVKSCLLFELVQHSKTFEKC